MGERSDWRRRGKDGERYGREEETRANRKGPRRAQRIGAANRAEENQEEQ